MQLARLKLALQRKLVPHLQSTIHLQSTALARQALRKVLATRLISAEHLPSVVPSESAAQQYQAAR